MPKHIDLTGQTFGQFLVLSRDENDRRKDARFNCRCVCGGSAVVRGQDLLRGATQSCGCYRNERLRTTRTLPVPPRAELEKRYVTRHESTYDLATRYGASRYTVAKWLRDYGIAVRDSATATGIAKKKAAWNRRKKEQTKC
ncbi:MAG: hypothetical protein H7Y38_05180 [Armatimonadetes bacterium]|nr:hypothetical protein [Armatimonadota bacterium]